mmetsp:Transcript_17542/g.19857  ORF Transcript_17542/g.19857 Transcript_17542/m.19857 type:complete len:118 (+) Transcript_17542:2-355(+)
MNFKYTGAPIALIRMFSFVDERIDQCMIDGLRKGTPPGYDGSKLVKELGFEYKHTNVTDTLRDVGLSFFEQRIATRGQGAYHFIWVFAPGVLAGAFTFVGIKFYQMCCGKVTKRKAE